MDGDLVLQWLSLRGRGAIADAVSSIAALMECRPESRKAAARAYLKRLETLGHIDLLWEENKWRIRPAMVTQLPGSSAFALFVGKRTQESEDQLELDAVLHRVEPAKHVDVLPTDPKVLLLEYDHEADLGEFAVNAGASFVPNAAFSAAEHLLLLAPGPRSAGPNLDGAQIQMFDKRSSKFIEIEKIGLNGLFRQIVNGRNKYWLSESGLWTSSDHAEGICMMMSGVDSGCLRLRILEDGDDSIGSLLVDGVLPLPIPQRRALVLCSGVNPVRTPDGAWAYENVPTSIAMAVARSVHQHLQMS